MPRKNSKNKSSEIFHSRFMDRVKSIHRTLYSSLPIYRYLTFPVYYFYLSPRESRRRLLKYLNTRCFQERFPWILYYFLYKKYVQLCVKDTVTNSFSSLILHIEPTNACNAACVTCPNKSQTRKIGFMSYDLYCRIVDQRQELGIQEIRHSFLGEPLLDKDLSRKIAYARSKGIENTVFTNASLLTEKRTLELIEAGLDNIYVSIDAASKEKFEETRKNLDFNVVRDNTQRCVEIRNGLNLTKPRLFLNFIVTKDNENEVEPFLHFWKEKVNHISISPAHNFSGGVDVNSSETNIFSRLRSKFYVVPCYYIWNFMFVLWNGDVSACCLDYDGKLILGNVKKNSLKDIWYGEKARTLRNKHLNGDIEDIPQCWNCSMVRNQNRWL